MNLYATIFIALIIGGTIYSAYEKGFENATNEANLRQLQANEAYRAELDATKQNLLETERAWLDDESEQEVIFKDKVRTVTNVVEKIVVRDGLANCRVGNDGMQAINKALSQTTPSITK